MTNETPGINPDLIARYMRAGDLSNLLTVFDFQRRQMTRAEDLSRAYLAQMIELKKRLDAVGAGENAEPRAPRTKAPPSTKVPSASPTTPVVFDDL